MDIATLAVEVDSRSVRTAEADLNRMTGAGARAEKSLTGVGAGGRSAASGAQAAASGIRSATQQMQNQERAARSLTSAIRAYATIAVSAFSVAAMARYADAWSDMQSVVGAAVKNMEVAPMLMRRMVDIANASYSPLQQTVDVYARNVTVLRELGRTSAEAADFTESLNNMLVITATRGQRATSVQEALSKAMAVGRLQADGLETILANGGRVAEALAQQLGTTVNGLRDMASQGKITAEVIANALIDSLQQVRKEAAEMPATIQDAFMRIGNNVTELVGRIDKAAGVSSTLAERIIDLADGVRTAGDYIIRFGQLAAPVFDAIGSGLSAVAEYADIALVGLAGFAAPALIGGVVTLTAAIGTGLVGAIKAVTAAMLANPVGLLVGALSAGAYAAYKFRDEIQQAVGIDVVDIFKRSANFLISSFLISYEQIKFTWNNFGDMMGAAVIGGVNIAIRAINGLIQKAAEGVDGLIKIINKIPGVDVASIGESFGIKELDNPYADRLNESLDALRAKIDEIAGTDHVGKLADAISAAFDPEPVDEFSESVGGAGTSVGKLSKELKKWLDETRLATATARTMTEAYLIGGDAISQLARQAEIEAKVLEHGAKARDLITAAIHEQKAAQDRLEIAKQIDDVRRQIESGTRYVAVLAAQSKGYTTGRTALAAYNREQAISEALVGKTADEVADLIEAYEELWETLEGVNEERDAAEELNRLVESNATKQEKFNRELEKLLALAPYAKTEEQARALERAIQDLQRENSVWFDLTEEAIERIDEAFANMWRDWMDGSRSAFDAMKRGFKQMLAEMAHAAITRPIMITVGNALLGTNTPGGIGDVWGGGFGLGGTTFGAGAVEMAGDWLLRSGLAPETGANMLMNADSIANVGNSILGYASSIFDIAEGRYGAGIGAAIGTYILPGLGTVAGRFFGSLIDDIFGDDKPDTRHAQMAHAELMGDGKVHVSTWDDRQSVESQKAAAQIAEQSINAALSLFDKIGIDAEFKRFTTLMESSILGDKQGVGSSATIRIGDLEHEIGLAIESSWTKHGYGGWSDAEMLPRLATDIQLTLLEAFQVAGDALPSMLSSMLADVDIRSLSAEQAQALAQAFQVAVEQINAMQSALQALPFITLRDVSFEVTANLIEFAGGMEALGAGVSAYYEHFYSQEEKLAWASEQMAAKFGELGLAMPDLTQGAEMARMEFRRLVESMDPMTEEGQRAIATLMTMAGGFNELVAGLDDLKAATDNTANALRERESLERQLLSLYGNTAALRALELGNLDASNRALQQRIWALQDEAAAYQEAVAKYNQARANTDAAWATVQAVAQREIARLQETFAQTDSIYKALTKAADVQRRALTEQARAAEQLIATLRGVIDITGSAARDLRGSVAETAQMQYAQAMDVIRRAAGGELPERDQLAEAITAARNVVENPDQYATGFERDFAMLSLANELERIQNAAEPQLSVQEQALEVAKQQQQALENMLQEAKAQIDVLRGVDDKLYEQVLETIKTQLTSQGQLDKLSDIDVNTFVAERLMQDLVTAQLAEQQARLQIDAINNQVSIAQDSYNELRGINNKTSSMITALNNLAKAMDAERVTNPGTPTGGGTPTVVIPDVITSANHGFERYQVMGKRNYMPTTTAEWLDYINLQPDLKAAYAAEVARGARTYSDAHMVEWARWHYETSGKKEMHVRRYASGGFYPGGLALVGEEGPEFINFAQPGQVYTASQTQDLLRRLSNPVENTSVIARHIERLTQENVALRQTVETLGRATVELQYRMVRMLERWETDGMPDTREELQAQMLETLEDIKENGIKVVEEVSE